MNGFVRGHSIETAADCLPNFPAGYREHAPPAHAAHAVECVWRSVSVHAERVPVDPDGCVDVLLRWTKASHEAPVTHAVSIVGAMSRSEIVSVNTGDIHIGVRFRPGWAASLLRAPVDHFTDRVRPLDRYAHLDPESLIRAVVRVEHFDALASAVCAFVTPAPPDADEIQRAIDALVRSHGRLSLNALSDIANLGERQFRRVCIARTGLSPKRLARVLRFRNLTIALRASPPAPMSEVAAAHGYSDQSHMIRDARQLSGRTPVALSAARGA